MIRIRVLREEYCNHCNISGRSPRSTGIKLLESVIDREGFRPRLIIDYGCSTWRNTKYLVSKYGCESVRVDAIIETRPDVVAYPTYLPFRDGAADAVLFTHILMFMNSKDEWPKAISELRRVSRRYIVLEAYHVKNPKALKYNYNELAQLIEQSGLRIIRRNVRQDMENLVLI